MTTICAVVTESGGALVTDGLATASDVVTRTNARKIRMLNEDWAIALAGSALAMVLVDELASSKANRWTDAQSIAWELKHVMRQRGWPMNEESGSPPTANICGFAIRRCGAIYELFSDFEMERLQPVSVRAAGSGAQYAMGAATLAIKQGQSALAAAKDGVHIACGIDIYSGGTASWVEPRGGKMSIVTGTNLQATERVLQETPA